VHLRPALRALLLVVSLVTTVLAAGITGASAATGPVPASPSNLPAGVEALQPYVGQSTCDPVAKPGVMAFANLLLDTYTDTTSLGIVRDCGIGGQSEHKEGRAFDWGVSVNNARQVSEVNALLGWLLKTDIAGNKAAAARRFGIMYMVWNRQMWRAYDIDKGWQTYTGPEPHTDHVHFSFGWSGAKQATSWWSGKVAPTDYGPDGKLPITPQRLPANLLVLATYGSTVLKQPTGTSTARTTTESAATKVVQTALAITADGDFGPDTTTAVKAFQTDQKLTVDGVVNSDDWLALFPKPQVPFGKLESTVFGIPGTVVVTGWAADADTQDPIRVHLYVDGTLNQAVIAGDSRQEIEKQYPGMGPELGYTLSLTLPDDGVHQVCAYGINVGAGTTNPKLGCLSVNVRHQPYGHSDALTLVPGSLVSRGWVYDPDSTDAVQVSHTVDGTPLVSVPANGSRPDIGTRYPAYGAYRGYSSAVDLSTVAEGSHTVCAVATNIDAGKDLSMACTTGVVRHTPFGSFDSLVQTPTALTLGGWAIEPDVAGPATITGTLDGKEIPSVQASGERADIARLYPINGSAHGFATTLPVPASEGNHTVCLTITNVGAGPVAPAKCRTIAVTHKPVGRFDVVNLTKAQVTVRGWAVDPDTVDAILIHVRIDGALAGRSLANQGRSDVARNYPAYGAAHGYRYTPTAVLKKGVHNVCVYAINTGAGSGNSILACRKVSVP
jgi:hypothetical protein